MIAFAQVTAEGDSATFNPPVGVDAPESAHSRPGVAISRGRNACTSQGWTKSTVMNESTQHGCVKSTNAIGSNHLVAPRLKIGRILMSVLQFPAPATVNAPVCGNCRSINTSPHWNDAYGKYFICEDCMAQLDENGARI